MSDEDSGGVSVSNESRDGVRATYDWSTTSPTTSVVETVTAVTGREPTQLDPLFKSLDPDALDTLIRSTLGNSDSRVVRLSFRYNGQAVTVRSHGEVAVTERHGPDGLH